MIRAVAIALAVIVAVVVAVLAGFRWRAHTRENQTRIAAAPATGHFVQAADVQIYVQEVGAADAPVVLFIHGMGAWSEIWRATLTATADAGWRAVALDLPPFGFSERPAQGNYSREAQARRIIGVLDALGVRRAILVGHSFGGGPTLEAVLLAPERVSALVLADPAIGLDATNGSSLPALVLGFRPIRNAVVATTITNPMFTRRILQLFIADPAAATDERVTMLRMPQSLEGTTGQYGDWLFDFMTTTETPLSQNPEAYRALSLPTLLIWGEADRTTPLAQGRRLNGLIAGSVLSVMPGIGHMPQIEDPPQFNELLLAFLKRQRRR